MKHIAAALALALLVSSCIIVVSDNGAERWNDRDSSVGPQRTDLRTVGEFHAVELRGSSSVRVDIGPAQPVAVTGGEGQIAFVRTEVQDGVLVIETLQGRPSSRRSVQIQVTVPALDAVSVAGSGGVTVTGLKGHDFQARVAGSGKLRVTGQVEKVDVALDGSGDAELYGLAARAVVVRSNGSGDVHVAPTETLDVQLVGSGDVRYSGNARVTSSVHGSGSLRRDD